MNARWDGAAPPPLPPFRAAGWVRLAWRAAAAIALTAAAFAAFLLARVLDRAGAVLLGRPVEGLAPGVLRLWARVALLLAGLRYRTTGAPMERPGALVANHASWLDVVVLMRAARVSFVAKGEVAGWPAIGAIARAIGTVFVERRAQGAKREAARLQAKLARGDRLAIFPEGTSTDGRRVLPFKSALFGVFVAPDLHDRLWIQPVAIVYHPAPGLPARFYGWWGERDFASHARDVLALSRGGTVEAVFTEPLRAADFADRKALAARAEAAVRREFVRRLPGEVEAAAEGDLAPAE